jgi:hypothetical protein
MNMATSIGATTAQPAQARAHLVTSMCACGQDLDIYRSKHCPRCGITLHPTHSFAPAA